MIGFVLGTLATAVAFAVLAYLIPEFDYGDDVVSLLVLSVIFGLVNGVIKPIVKLFALPLTMATLGLFSVVINAGLLLFVAWLAGSVLNVTFSIAGFPPDFSVEAIAWAGVGAVVLSIITSVIGLVVPDR